MKLLTGFLFIALSFNAFASITKPLPEEDALAAVAEEVGTQFSDENISTGTTSLSAGLLKISPAFKDEAAFVAFMKKSFAETFSDKESTALPKSARLEIQVGNYSKADLAKMVSATMESNDYTPTNNETKEALAKTLSSVLRKLPANEKTLVGHVKTKVEDETSGEIRSVQYFALINADKKTVQLFTIQGSM